MNDEKEVLRVAVEYNSKGYLIHLEDYPGAFTRGETLDQALGKVPAELVRYHRWSDRHLYLGIAYDYKITQSQLSQIAIHDADSDILFDSEKFPLSAVEYRELKSLALKSARDFLSLYSSIPDKDRQIKESRETFYGQLPSTASAMYRHTKSVNPYYFAGIGLSLARNEDIVSGREQGFLKIENRADYLSCAVFKADDGEYWSLRKVLRRFIWHDAIHAKAMYRSACRTFTEPIISNPFCF
ncbi:MAG: hypothetical protein GX809_00140 [Clostridiaceae bacterium]|nr:hypothetical protein [Clostridiaceae bacterium]